MWTGSHSRAQRTVVRRVWKKPPRGIRLNAAMPTRNNVYGTGVDLPIAVGVIGHTAGVASGILPWHVRKRIPLPQKQGSLRGMGSM
jgi:hypothetical protein